MKKILYICSPLIFAVALFLIYIQLTEKEGYPKPKNIVFLLFDAMRPDHLNTYGYSRNTSPAIDSIAKDGILFEKAFSQASWTLPSVASTFTSTYTDFHGTENMTSKLPKTLVTLAEYLNKSGFRTIGASNNYLVSRHTRMARGFWDWVDEMRDPALTNYLLSYIDPEGIDYYRIWKDNFFSDYSFTRLNPNLQKAGDSYTYGYFDRSAFRTSFSRSKKNDYEILSTAFKPAEPGNYNWGAAVKNLHGKGMVTLTLIALSPEGLKIIDQKKIEPSKNWEKHSFSLTTNERLDKIQICFGFKDELRNSPDFEFAIDDVFLMKAQKRPAKTNYFFYLHYINPHEPHHEPKEIRGTYAHLFKDFLKPSQLISASPGDPFDMTNAKYILHRSRIDNWIKENDDINHQFNMYDREIKYMDDQVARIVKYLKKIGDYEDTMFIITADHGEEFLEHGHISHGLSLYNEVVHIPLIISYPRAFPKGIRIKQNVASIDIFPTLIEMIPENTPFEEKLKQQISGKSLLPMIDDPDDSDNERTIFTTDYFTSQTAVIFDKWKFIKRQSACGDAEVLFDSSKDFRESHNLSIAENSMTKNLNAVLDKYKKTASSFRKKFTQTNNPQKILEKDSERMKKGLLELGYINPSDDVFKISQKFEDVYCHVVRFRLQIKFALKMLRLN
jgi:arylsulfatase A-like enzyme